MTVSEESKTLCRNVRYLRKKYHLSKKSMAMLMDIDTKSLRLMENEVLSEDVTVDFLFRMHSVFQLPIDSLFSVVLEDT